MTPGPWQGAADVFAREQNPPHTEEFWHVSVEGDIKRVTAEPRDDGYWYVQGMGSVPRGALHVYYDSARTSALKILWARREENTRRMRELGVGV